MPVIRDLIRDTIATLVGGTVSDPVSRSVSGAIAGSNIGTVPLKCVRLICDPVRGSIGGLIRPLVGNPVRSRCL